MIHSESCELRAFVVSTSDNVGTLLTSTKKGEEISLIGENAHSEKIKALEDIGSAHKVALVKIEQNEPVIKYGHRIGHATKQILPGEWVHLQNCASDVDERSNTLDIHSGVPQDISEAYE